MPSDAAIIRLMGGFAPPDGKSDRAAYWEALAGRIRRTISPEEQNACWLLSGTGIVADWQSEWAHAAWRLAMPTGRQAQNEQPVRAQTRRS